MLVTEAVARPEVLSKKSCSQWIAAAMVPACALQRPQSNRADSGVLNLLYSILRISNVCAAV